MSTTDRPEYHTLHYLRSAARMRSVAAWDELVATGSADLDAIRSVAAAQVQTMTTDDRCTLAVGLVNAADAAGVDPSAVVVEWIEQCLIARCVDELTR